MARDEAATGGGSANGDREPTWVRLQFNPADHRRVRMAAAARGRSMAAFARDVVLEAVAAAEARAAN